MVSIKQMQYCSYEQAEEENRGAKILCDSVYKGFRFLIIDYSGSHPCAYIEIPKDHPLYGLDDRNEEGIFFPVHGGITFGDNHLMDIITDSWVIGWDYAHLGDRCRFESGDEHSTFSILEEIIEAINEVISWKK